MVFLVSELEAEDVRGLQPPDQTRAGTAQLYMVVPLLAFH